MGRLIEGKIAIQPPRCWMLDVTAKHPSVAIRILDSKIPDGSDYVHELFEINGTSGGS